MDRKETMRKKDHLYITASMTAMNQTCILNIKNRERS